MKLLSLRSVSVSVVRLSAGAALAAAGLTGCYVVPMQLGQTLPPGPVTVVSAQSSVPPTAMGMAPAAMPAPSTQNFTARLYPSNAEASRYGTVTGVVTNDLNGHGNFVAVINGEQFQGEATRAAGSQRGGVANASGARGGILNCQYTMNSATLGTGNCVLNSGPAFTMHIGG